MTNEEESRIMAIVRRLLRYSKHIEIEWNGMEELATYADLPLSKVLEDTAWDLANIVEGREDEGAC